MKHIEVGDSKNREPLQKAVKKNTTFDALVWNQIDDYYEIRCDLYHESSTKTISDDSMDDYYELVEFVINQILDLNVIDHVILPEPPKQGTIDEKEKVRINKINSIINKIVVAVKQSKPKNADDISNYFKEAGNKTVIAKGIINQNLKHWYPHFFFLNSKTNEWQLSDEGESRYKKINQDSK